MFDAPFGYGGAELGGPDFEGDSEGVRRCLTVGRNKVPPFSTGIQRRWISRVNGGNVLTNAGRHDDGDQKVYQDRGRSTVDHSPAPSSL